MIARHSFSYIPVRTPLDVLKRSISSKASAECKPITLSLVIPPSVKAAPYDFESVQQIEEFIKSQKATVRGPSLRNPGHYAIIPPRRFNELSPSVTYEILSPGWTGYQGDFRHSQVSDKAFEDKSRLALMAHMQSQGLKFKELDRIVSGPVGTIAEWEGVFNVFPGRLYFLECKHSVTGVHLSFVVLF
jgi:hypothetical protein